MTVLDDPYGIKQAEWAVAQRPDLEHLFSEAREIQDWYRQFVYARKLEEEELDRNFAMVALHAVSNGIRKLMRL